MTPLRTPSAHLLRAVSLSGVALTSSVACDKYTCLDTASCTVSPGDGGLDSPTVQASQSSPSDLSATNPSSDSTSDALPSATNSNSTQISETQSSSSTDQDRTSTELEPTDDGGATNAPQLKLANGLECEGAAQCDSGFCVDGFCCNRGCAGVCAACDLPNSKGICSAPASDTACPEVSCGTDTECLRYENTSSSDNCSAINSCITEASCKSHPSPDSTPCGSGAGTCNGDGECIVPNKKSLGQTCEAADECGSGACSERVDGIKVCCDGDCGGACQACSSAGYCNEKPPDDDACGTIDCPSDTTCANYTSDVTSSRCASFGQCKTTTSECTAETAPAGTSCGTDKICDGTGSCADCPSESGEDRTCSAECPCDAGEGVCSSHAQCSAGLVCVVGGAVKYGFEGNTCLPAHCDNNVKDAGESSVDCGGDCACGARFDSITLRATLTGISDDGNVVVAFSSGQASKTAYVWDSDDQFSVLSTSHTARGISGDGRVIIGDGNTFPVRWVSKGQPETLLSSPQFTNGAATTVSRDGSVIAGSANSVSKGFVWSSGTATSVTSVGWLQEMTADASLFLGFASDGTFRFWNAASGVSVPMMPGGSFTSADQPRLSANGRYVVGPAVLWDRTLNTVTQLRALPTINASPYAARVSDAGVVVGQTCLNCEGTYWAPADGYEPHPFAELMAEYGVELPTGMTLGPVRLASPNGKSFAGEIWHDGDVILWRLRIK